MPRWVSATGADTPENLAFRAGAALAVLDHLVGDAAHGVPLRLLANQLALRAATATSALEGRLAREADIRDAYHLAPPGGDPGPDGEGLGFWRRAARIRLGAKGWADEVAALAGARFAPVDLTAGILNAARHGYRHEGSRPSPYSRR